MKLKKIQKIVLVTLVVLMFSAALAPLSYSAELTAKENAVAFMSEVGMIDQSKQTVTLKSYSVNPFDSDKEDLSYTVESDGTTWDALFQFTNDNVSAYTLRAVGGAVPLYAGLQSAEVFEEAKSFLQRYGDFKVNNNFAQDADLAKMMTMLDSVNELKTTTVTADLLRFEIIREESYIQFNWVTAINGADYSTVSLTFEEYCFTFMDDRNNYGVGKTDVNVTVEEAVSIALKAAETYSYTVNGTEISGFDIAEDHITTKLLTRPQESKLYPYWAVELGLEELYPGNIYGIRVNLWAGNSEIIETYGLGFGGSLTPQYSNNEPSALTSDDSAGLTLDSIIIGTVLAAAVIVIAAAIVIKKKRG